MIQIDRFDALMRRCVDGLNRAGNHLHSHPWPPVEDGYIAAQLAYAITCIDRACREVPGLNDRVAKLVEAEKKAVHFDNA